MNKKTRMTERDWKIIKKLLGSGLTDGEIRDITGRSTGTTSNVRNSDSYEDYRQKITNSIKASRERIKAKKMAKESKLHGLPPGHTDKAQPVVPDNEILKQILVELKIVNKNFNTFSDLLEEDYYSTNEELEIIKRLDL